MELDLKELVATLTIGASLIFGIEFAVLNFFGKTISEKIFGNLYKEDKAKDRFIMGAVLATLCFVLGMVFEDISSKFVDDGTGWLPKNKIIESDEDIKFNIFYGKDLQNPGKSEFVRIAVENGLISKIAGDEGVKFENYIKGLGERPSDEELKKVVNRFYYNAKNRVYQNDTYYDEMKKIQMRIDFSRSMVAVTTVLFGIILLVFFIKSVFVLVNYLLCKFNKMHRTQNFLKKCRDYLFEVRDLRWRRFMISETIILTIMILAMYAYSSEEAEFNKRTYGYYLSLKTDLPKSP